MRCALYMRRHCSRCAFPRHMVCSWIDDTCSNSSRAHAAKLQSSNTQEQIVKNQANGQTHSISQTFVKYVHNLSTISKLSTMPNCGATSLFLPARAARSCFRALSCALAAA